MVMVGIGTIVITRKPRMRIRPGGKKLGLEKFSCGAMLALIKKKHKMKIYRSISMEP